MPVDSKLRYIAQYMIERDKALKHMQGVYERMSRLIDPLPDTLNAMDWVIPVKSTSPYDSIRGATRALSNLDEALTIEPVTVHKVIAGDDEGLDAREQANLWERILQWELGRSNKRRRNLRADMVWSAATYDEICVQLVNIPNEFAITQPKASRRRAALRFGDWAVKVFSPKDVYVTYSDYMPEAVLSASVKTAEELMYHWGPDMVPKIAKKVQDDQRARKDLYVEYDYVDHSSGRSVWYMEGRDLTADNDGEYIIKPQPWMADENGDQVPFLPWVCVAGGTTVDMDPVFQRKPILFPVAQSGLWSTANILGAIVMSKAVSTAAAPEHLIFGPQSEDIDIDYTTPGGRMDFPSAQLYQYQAAPQRALDPKLTEAYDRLIGMIQRSTVAEVLVTAQPVSGEQAYASYNLQVQQALASIGNVKELGERGFEGLYEHMLLIAHYTGRNIESYANGLDKYQIDSDKIDPEIIQLGVELKTDVPMDRLARINAAAQLAGSGIPYSYKAILESLGVTDPEKIMRDWARERVEMADMQGLQEYVQAERSGMIQQMAQQMAQQMMQQQMEQQMQMAQMQQAQAGQQGGPMGEMGGPFGELGGGPANTMRPQGGVEGVEGAGYNAAEGGIPAGMGAPEESTREARQAVAGLGPIGRL